MTEIGVLSYPGSQQASLFGLTDLFGVAGEISEQHGGPRLVVSHWRMNPAGQKLERVFSTPGESSGLAAVVIPGALHSLPTGEGMEPWRAWLRSQHAAGVALCSVCGGAFLLADTGLLDGRAATTHWMFARQLAELHPAIQVEPDRLVIEETDIVTAGGMMAWVDLGLKLVYRFLGPTVMLETARFFVVDSAGREQRFYSSFSPNLNHGDELVLQIQHWLQQHYADSPSVAAMAARSQLSERTFLRRFHKATGFKPTEYVQNLRVGKAREALEFSKDTVNEIAWKVGYEDPAAFRKIFHRLIGLSPGDYRRRFALN